MAQKLVIGDLVKLKSDGPWMTVTNDKHERGSKFVIASWFDGSSLNANTFHKDALDAQEKPAAPAAPSAA